MEERIVQLEKQVKILWDLLEIFTYKGEINEWKESAVLNQNHRDIKKLVEEVNRLERYKQDK